MPVENLIYGVKLRLESGPNAAIVVFEFPFCYLPISSSVKLERVFNSNGQKSYCTNLRGESKSRALDKKNLYKHSFVAVRL